MRGVANTIGEYPYRGRELADQPDPAARHENGAPVRWTETGFAAKVIQCGCVHCECAVDPADCD